MEAMIYHGVYDRAADGTIWGSTPEFPGALGAGDTLEEARASLRKGIEIWIEADIDFGHGHIDAMPDELVEIVDLSEMERPPIAL
jgi:predicted RNase H-like HicB family nuclease